MAQHDLPALAPRGELDARERIDRDQIGRKRADVSQGDIGARGLEQRGDVPADRGEVGTGNRPGDGNDNGGRPHGRHL